MTLAGYALIFGGGNGIGRETGYNFAERGISGVVFADIDEDAAQISANESRKLAIDRSFRSLAVKVDVANRTSVQEAIAVTVEQFGRIDFSINCAGVGAGMETSVIETPTEEFDRTHNVNARGSFFVIAEVAKVLVQQEERFVQGRSGQRSMGRGSIINVSSLNGRVPVPGHVQYGASKFAAIGITVTAASELARKGVRVNCLLPSWVDTQMMHNDISRVPGLLANIEALSPAGRMAYPEEIAEAIHFLCTPGASYIHGIELVVDAGLSLTRGLA